MSSKKSLLFIICISAISLQSAFAAPDIRIERIGRQNLASRSEVRIPEEKSSIKDIVFKNKDSSKEEKSSVKKESEKINIISFADSKALKIKEISSGKGTWVNLWNYPKDMDKFITRLKTFNINTVYLQVNRSNTPVFKLQTEIDQILKAAHANDIKVVGWSYCYLNDVNGDAKKFIDVAQYVSPDGESFDAMAADIEENIALPAVKAYTEKIKKALPEDYLLIAIVFSPRIKQDYPWEYVANNWDVLMPMTYWHGLKNRNDETVYNFVKESITDLRRLSKKENLNIHLITDGDRTSHNEVAASLRAAKDHGVNAGISIYPEHLASDEMLKKLGVHQY